MMAAHLNAASANAVQIRVWTIQNGVLEMTKLVYPDGRAEEFGDVVDLLKSNGVVEHHDLMRRYARRGEINGRRRQRFRRDPTGTCRIECRVSTPVLTLQPPYRPPISPCPLRPGADINTRKWNVQFIDPQVAQQISVGRSQGPATRK